MLKAMAESPGFDFLICRLTEEGPFGIENYGKRLTEELNACVDVAEKKSKPLVVILSNPPLGTSLIADTRWQTLFEVRERLLSNGIPIFSSNRRAASAVGKVVQYYRRREESRATSR